MARNISSNNFLLAHLSLVGVASMFMENFFFSDVFRTLCTLKRAQ